MNSLIERLKRVGTYYKGIPKLRISDILEEAAIELDKYMKTASNLGIRVMQLEAENDKLRTDNRILLEEVAAYLKEYKKTIEYTLNWGRDEYGIETPTADEMIHDFEKTLDK